MARRTRSRAAARQGLARTRTHSANSETAASRWGRSQYRRRLRLEALEDRRLLAGITVTTLADTVDFNDGVTSLREAIFAANTVAGPDTIEFAPSLTANGPATILLTQGELKITDSLTIDGPGSELLTVDASGNDPTPDDNNGDGSRVFWIDDNQLSSLIDVTIDGMVITGGDLANMVGIALSSGGAIFTRENVVLNHVAVVGNASQRFGGAVYVEHGSLRVSESMISDNNAQSLGGGIYAYSSTLLVENSIIESNSALPVEAASAGGGGGGIRARESSVSITGSLINRNISGASGGGIALQGSGLNISSSTISGNIAKWGGGGILAESGLTGGDQPLSIVDTTITNNTSFVQGGGILLRTSNAVISGSTITGNQVEQGDPIPARYHGGGGVAHFSGSLLIQNSILMGNSIEASADGSGGAVFSTSRLTLVGSQVLGNSSSGDGGGLGFLLNTEAVIQDSVIAGNSAGAKGGGISYRWRELQDPTAIPNARVVIEGSSIRDNVAGTDGGGIYAFGSVLVDESQVSANFAAAAAGGGIFAVGSVTLVGSTVNENSTSIVIGQESTGGGGVYAVGEVVVDRSTVSGNSSLYGGGVFSATAVTARHSTIAKNVARLDGDAIGTFGSVLLDHAIVAGFSDVIGSPNAVSVVPVTAKFSLIGRAYGTTLAEAPLGAPDENGNLIGGPAHGFIDAKLGPLADNGGFELPDGSRILTHALLPGSPAINAGNLNAEAGEGGVPEFDQRGESFGRIVGGRIDIGAFEYQTPTDLKLLVDTLVDESDGDYSRGDLSLREAIELANAATFAGVVDTIRFDPALWAARPATILLTQGELKITDSLNINGPGAGLLTIDASGNDPTPAADDGKGSRVFVVGNSGVLGVRLVGLTLTGGDVLGSGGAILNSTALAIRDCVILDNSASEGGGVASSTFATGSGLSILNSRVTGNRALGSGGGIVASSVGDALEVDGSTISGNQSATGNGGGIYFSGTRASISIQSSVISENHGGRTGGGACFGLSFLSSIAISDSTFADNVATQRGGGIYNLAELSIRNTVISRNSARNGGGIDSRAQKPLEIIDSTISGNLANSQHSNGYGYGGGIAHMPSGFGGAMTVVGSVIIENSASRDGGGISSRGGQSLTIAGSWIEGNHADNNGGGVHGLHTQITITDSEIATNSSGVDGGGVYARSGMVTIEGVNVTENFAGRDAGGLNIGRLTLTASAIQNNVATRDGGGLLVGGTVVGGAIAQSTITGNSAGRNGGGMYGAAAVTSSTFSGNHAEDTGGGLWIVGNSSVLHSTVTDNIAEVAGGGLFAATGVVTVNHAIVAGNEGLLGPDFTGLSGTAFDVHFSLIGWNKNTGLALVVNGLPDANGNIIGGPEVGIDPLLGPLADNGGPTKTHALLSNSPARNAGNPAAVAGVDGVPVHDQRGAPFTRVFGGRIDMGAVESIPVGVLPGDYNRNAVVDAADYSVWRDRSGASSHPGPLPMGEGVIGDGNGDGVVDQLDYEVWKANFGATVEELGAGSRPAAQVPRQGDKAASAPREAKVVEHAMVLPLAEPGADGRVSDRPFVEGFGPQTRVVRSVGRRGSDVVATLSERLLDAWSALRDRVLDDAARAESGPGESTPVAAEAVDFAVAELGRLRLSLRG